MSSPIGLIEPKIKPFNLFLSPRKKSPKRIKVKSPISRKLMFFVNEEVGEKKKKIYIPSL